MRQGLLTLFKGKKLVSDTYEPCGATKLRGLVASLLNELTLCVLFTLAILPVFGANIWLQLALSVTLKDSPDPSREWL